MECTKVPEPAMVIILLSTLKLVYNNSYFIAETEEDGKIKQKQLELKSRISDNDFQFQGAKIIKWLEKGQFVSVSIKTAKSRMRLKKSRRKLRNLLLIMVILMLQDLQ